MKARRSSYMMNKCEDLKIVFKFLDAHLILTRFRPNPTVLLAHNSTLSKGSIARYNLTGIAQKTSTFSVGSKSLSIDNAFLGPIRKRLLFTMVKITDFIGSLESNVHNFSIMITVIFRCL